MSDFFSSLFDTGPDYAGLARQQEGQRQTRITMGTNLINSIFGGGTADIYNPVARNQLGAWQSPGNYYTFERRGRGYVPFTQGAGALGRYANAGKLFTKSSATFGGFQPSFFDQRAQDYINYAMPQLSEQYNVAKNQMGYGLANRGLLGSSAAGTQASQLQRSKDRSARQISDAGTAQAQQLRREVEQARQNALSQLYATADPANAGYSAIQSAAGFMQPTGFPAIGNMFADFANSYYQGQLMNSYRQPAYIYPSQYPGYSAGGLPNITYSGG